MFRACFSSVHVPQIWMSSPESTAGTIREPGKIIEYEEQWHADIFVPCLKTLRAEVCVHGLFDVVMHVSFSKAILHSETPAIPPSLYIEVEKTSGNLDSTQSQF